jgi:hypothetical protein
MIAYLVSATATAGVDEALRRGWTRLAAFRFATPQKHDIRLVTRIADLVPTAGVTLLIKGSDYDSGPPAADGLACRAWQGRDGAAGQRVEFDAFVASGKGRWISGDDEIPINQGVQYGAAQDAGEVSQF